jgi:ATP-dependent protease ClpP protease subunit
MKDFQHILNASAEKSTIRISGEVNQYTADRFIEEFNYLVEQVGCKLIEVKINSQGGSVLAGYSIVSTILDSKVEVQAVISGLAASIASVIALACDKVFMTDYSVLMVHNVYNSSNANPDPKEQEVLNKFNSSLRKIYAKRGIEEEVMTSWMDNETFFDASEALSFGLIDTIIPTATRKVEAENKTIEELFNIFNSLDMDQQVTLNKPNKMQEELINFLGLEEGTEQTEIFNALQILKGEAADLKIKNEGLVSEIANKDSEIEQLQNQVNDFEAAEKQRKVLMAEELVNSAVEARKIPATSKEHWLELANQSFDTTKAVLSSLSTNIKLSNLIQEGNAEPKTEKVSIANIIKEQVSSK